MNDQQLQAPLEEQTQQGQNQGQSTPTQVPAQNRQPEDTVRDVNIKATIWRREGQKQDFFTTDLAKTYRDKDGVLKDTHNFNKDDLLRVAEIARRAHNRVSELSRLEFMKRRDNGQSRSQSQARQPSPNKGR